MGVILLLVATFVPYQVAFVISWMVLIWHCSSFSGTSGSTNEIHLRPIAVPSRGGSPRCDPGEGSPTPASIAKAELYNENVVRHLLLLQTFLLPLQAPVLAVWIRTLATAGYTAPFDGDHNVFMVLPWLIIAEGTLNGVQWTPPSKW